MAKVTGRNGQVVTSFNTTGKPNVSGEVAARAKAAQPEWTGFCSPAGAPEEAENSE
jgi:hypothetical protein